MKRQQNLTSPVLEILEDRNCPAPLTFRFDTLGNLTIQGNFSENAGVPSLEIIATGANTFDIIDGTTTALSDITVTGSISIYTNDPRDEFVLVDLGGLNAVDASINGNLNVSLGAGDDTVMFDFNSPFSSSIGGNVTFNGVNTVDGVLFELGVNIGGSFTINNSLENVGDNIFVTTANIGNNFTYRGGNLSNSILFDSVQMGGSFFASMGNGGIQFVDFVDSSIGGMVNIQAGSGNDAISVDASNIGSNLYLSLGGGVNSLDFAGTLGGGLTYIGGSDDDIVVIDNAVIGGSLYFNMGNAGSSNGNQMVMTNSAVNGSSITYSGGIGVDYVEFGAGTVTNQARFTAQMGVGDDTFTLDSDSLGYLYIDFGLPGPNDADTFVPNIPGPFPFPVRLIFR